MNFRLFRGSSEAAVENVVNRWLAQEARAPAIHTTETRFHQTTTPNGIRLTTVTIGVWYEPGTAKAAKKRSK